MSYTKTILRPAYSMLERAIVSFLDFEAIDLVTRKSSLPYFLVHFSSSVYLQNLSTESLVIYMFCTSCKSEIVLPVLQIKNKNNFMFANCTKKCRSKHQSSNYGFIERTMDLSCILLAFSCKYKVTLKLWNSLITASTSLQSMYYSTLCIFQARSEYTSFMFHAILTQLFLLMREKGSSKV